MNTKTKMKVGTLVRVKKSARFLPGHVGEVCQGPTADVQYLGMYRIYVVGFEGIFHFRPEDLEQVRVVPVKRRKKA